MGKNLLRSEVRSGKKLAGLICVGSLGIPFYALGSKYLHGIKYSGVDSFASSFPYRIAPPAVLYLIGGWLACRFKPAEAKTAGLYAILVFAVLYRLLVMVAPPLLSSDMYRYVWDGRVQAHGINPYEYPPAAEALKTLRDGAIYPHINRQSSPTIYPGGAQLLFLALNKLGMDNVFAFKCAVVLFDTGSVLVLMLILSDLGLARERVLIYAWHPLVIYELAGSGHLDGFVLFFILLSLLLMIRKRLFASVAGLALAASLKLYPVVILPAVLREKKILGLLLFSIIFFSSYLPFIGVGRKIAGFLPQYFENPGETFNPGLKGYLVELFSGVNPLVFTGIFAAILLFAGVLIWIRRKDALSSLRFSYYLAGLSIVFTPASLQPWYVVWIIPFLALYPSPAWLYLSFSVGLSYLAYGSPGQALPAWARNTEYIPFFIPLAAEYAILLLYSGGIRFPWRSAEKSRSFRAAE